MAGDSDKITENGGNILSILIWLAGIGVIVGIVFFVIGAVRSGGDKLKSTISGAATQQFTQYDGMTKIPSGDVIGLATDVSIQGKGLVVIQPHSGSNVMFGDYHYGEDGKYNPDTTKESISKDVWVGTAALSARSEKAYVSPNDTYKGTVIYDSETKEVIGIKFEKSTK